MYFDPVNLKKSKELKIGIRLLQQWKVNEQSDKIYPEIQINEKWSLISNFESFENSRREKFPPI